MSGYIQSNQTVLLPNAITYNVSAADTGKILLIPAQDNPLVISLPTATLGLHYRFLLIAAVGNFTSITTGVAGGVRGVALTGNSTIPITAIRTAVNFAGVADRGDYIDAYCYSSTSWSISAGSQINGGISVT